MTHKVVSIYTGSSYPKHDAAFAKRCAEATKEMARLAGQNADIVQFGGGQYGHLLDVMNEVGKVGGRMRALIPPAFYDPKEVYPNFVEVVMVPDDVTRWRKFLDSDAHIVTPGGDGTVCEAFFSHNDNLSKLYGGGEMKPVAVMNLDGYYDHLQAWFNHAASVGYSSPERQEKLNFLSSPQAVANHLWPKP